MTTRSGKVTCDLSISVDGYSAGLNQTEERPFGHDGGDGWGSKLHSWMDDPEEARLQADWLAETKAFIMGRNMFGPVRGEWEGLVGGQPAVPRPGLRAHALPARPAADGGRHHLLLRHRRDQGRVRTGA
ncbi:hypothetical protein GCM10027176_52270 [Actinoallomurus bryophytorum]